MQKKQQRHGLCSFQASSLQAKTHGAFDMGVWCMEGSQTKRTGQTRFKAKRNGPSASGLPLPNQKKGSLRLNLNLKIARHFALGRPFLTACLACLPAWIVCLACLPGLLAWPDVLACLPGLPAWLACLACLPGLPDKEKERKREGKA